MTSPLFTVEFTYQTFTCLIEDYRLWYNTRTNNVKFINMDIKPNVWLDIKNDFQKSITLEFDSLFTDTENIHGNNYSLTKSNYYEILHDIINDHFSQEELDIIYFPEDWNSVPI